MNQPVMDHWTAVKRIHQSALDVDSPERGAFLDKSCGGDEALRREVESLLAYATDAETFLERPAVNIAARPSSESTEATLVGRTISHYRVLSLLGAGGMGEVYLALDPRLDRTVALKILPEELSADADLMQRFRREAKAASALNHPNVATIYDVGESDGIPFIVMEHVEGETLLARISRRMTPPEVVDIAVQAADALDLAHAKGITHRDIKPANLMLTHRGNVKVLDFGVAKLARHDEGSLNGEWTVEPVTAVGSVVGSAPYMSPEQIVGGDADSRSDVFSLGVVIYEMATKQLPFSGSTRAEMKDRILHAAPEAMVRLNPDIPPELERITLKCLDKRRDGRYQSARELLTDLWPLKRQLDANVARAMPDALRLELLRRPGSQAGAAADTPAFADDASTTDAARASEASELVARGWAHVRSGSYFEVSDAVSAFQAATMIDPTCAAAYAGLAHAKLGEAANRNVLVEAYGEAKAAALRALALDDESADARVALGQVMVFAEWDWVAAERSFQRALAIDPNHAHAYLCYGFLMEALGDLERGFRLKLQGLECDSTSALAHVQIALSFWYQRRYDDVMMWANKALDRDPHHSFARELQAGACRRLGDLERYAEILQRAGEVARELLSDVREVNFGEFYLVLQCAEVGDLDGAFEHLQRMFDAHDPVLVDLAVGPHWDSLRADPRFSQFLARMKLRPVL
jgi:serine/threonine protein kinase